MEIKSVINEIKDKIVNKYPLLNVYVKKVENEDEYFVLIDDKQVYNTDKFLDLISDIQGNILFPRQIVNISISYRLDNEKISENFFQIYSAPNYIDSSVFAIQEESVGVLERIIIQGITYSANIRNLRVNHFNLSQGATNQWITQQIPMEMEYDLAA